MTTPALPTASENDGETELWRRLHSDADMQAREQLIERYLPYARTVAASYYARRRHDEIEFADYHQLASMAVVESVDRYRPERGAQFKTFAARRMHGAILDGIEKLTEKQQQIAARQRLRQERLAALKAGAAAGSPAAADTEGLFAYLAEVGIGLALGMLFEGTGMVDNDAIGRSSDPEQPYRQVELALLKRRVGDLVRGLPDPQRRVLQWHYLHDHSFVDIAHRLELTKGRISQIHKQALESLRRALAARSSCDVTG